MVREKLRGPGGGVGGGAYYEFAADAEQGSSRLNHRQRRSETAGCYKISPGLILLVLTEDLGAGMDNSNTFGPSQPSTVQLQEGSPGERGLHQSPIGLGPGCGKNQGRQPASAPQVHSLVGDRRGSRGKAQGVVDLSVDCLRANPPPLLGLVENRGQSRPVGAIQGHGSIGNDHDPATRLLALRDGANSIDVGDDVVNHLAVRCIHGLEGPLRTIVPNLKGDLLAE